MAHSGKSKSWSDLLIIGVLMTIVGVLMIVFQAKSLNIILIVFGILLLVGGVIGAFVGVKEGSNPIILSGVIRIVIGVLILVLTALVRDILMVVLAIGLIIVGASNVLTGIKSGLEMKERILPFVVGAVFLVAGIYALFHLNGTADIVMIIIGAFTVFGGVLDLYDAYRLKTM